MGTAASNNSFTLLIFYSAVSLQLRRKTIIFYGEKNIL